MDRVQVSCIVPTFNGASRLPPVLKALMGQSGDRMEVIVADNGSTDDTEAVAAKFGAHYVREPAFGATAARHAGVRAASGDIFVFIDDDVHVQPGWLDAILDVFTDPQVGIVGGPSLPRYEVTPPVWLDAFWETAYSGRYCGWLSLSDLGSQSFDVDPYYVWTLNFAIRRATFLALGGLHPDLIPGAPLWQGDGETGLAYKARAASIKAMYDPRVKVEHVIPAHRLTPEYFTRRFYFQGIANSFTEVRAQGHPRRRLPTPKAAYLAARRMAGLAARRIGLRAPIPDDASETGRLKQRFEAAQQAGFDLHQRTVRTNPMLLAWVLREDYYTSEAFAHCGNVLSCA